MSHWTRFSFELTICAFILCISLVNIDCRGSRGGRYRGSSRSSRSGSSRMSKGSSSYSRSTWKAAFVGGYVLGSSRYLRSRRYYSHPYDMPTICTNLYDTNNSSGAQFSYFVCPREGEPDNFDYCCGNRNREYCCKYSLSSTLIVGIVFGCVIAAIVLFTVTFYIFKRIKNAGKMNKTSPDGNTELRAANVNVYPMKNAPPRIPPIGFTSNLDGNTELRAANVNVYPMKNAPPRIPPIGFTSNLDGNTELRAANVNVYPMKNAPPRIPPIGFTSNLDGNTELRAANVNVYPMKNAPPRIPPIGFTSNLGPSAPPYTVKPFLPEPYQPQQQVQSYPLHPPPAYGQ